MVKKANSEKIKCNYIYGIKIFVDPEWMPEISEKGTISLYKILHGEFFFRGSLKYCQIIVSDKFVEKLISEFGLKLNLIGDKFVWTKANKKARMKLFNLELEVEFLFLIYGKKNIGSDYQDSIGDIEHIFRLIE
jgi:hypothetical protein